MTIGLPSFLTKRENEKSIMVVYLLALIIVGIVGWWWWSNASKYHPSGVLEETWRFYYGNISEQMVRGSRLHLADGGHCLESLQAYKHLLETLSVSSYVFRHT